MKYSTRSFAVEAFQVTADMLNGDVKPPSWVGMFATAFNNYLYLYAVCQCVHVGEWVVKQGIEFRICDNETFEKDYIVNIY